MTLNELFSGIAEAIRGKRNSTSKFVASNFAAEINAIYTGQDATGTTAAHILKDKIVCINGTRVTGTIPSKAAETFTPGTSAKTIAAGQYLSGTQTIAGDANLVSANIISGKSIFGVAGNSNVVNTSAGTAAANHILSGKIAFVDGKQITGNIASQAAQTITPGTSNKTIAAGKYLSGIQTIKGDANLKAANIKSGVSIFGVTGTLQTGSKVLTGTDNMGSSLKVTYEATFSIPSAYTNFVAYVSNPVQNFSVLERNKLIVSCTCVNGVCEVTSFDTSMASSYFMSTKSAISSISRTSTSIEIMSPEDAAWSSGYWYWVAWT